MPDDNPIAAPARLRFLRKKAGYSMHLISSLAGYKSPTSYRYYETTYPKASLPYEFVERIKPALLMRGITETEIDDLSDAAEAIRRAVVSAAPLMLDHETFALAWEVAIELAGAHDIPVPSDAFRDLVADTYDIACSEKTHAGQVKALSVAMKWQKRRQEQQQAGKVHEHAE